MKLSLKAQYNPCDKCKRKVNGKCPMGKKDMCSEFLIACAIDGEENPFENVPDEIILDIIRKRGWHGELREETVVTV